MADMTKIEKTTCPYCARRVRLTKRGRLFPHLTRRGGPRCARSGVDPQSGR